jgi:predicted amidohydrolase
MLARILKDPEARGIVCDIGMPITHKNSTYNCRVIIHDGKIVLIRPKMWMANDGNYVSANERATAMLADSQLTPLHALKLTTA